MEQTFVNVSIPIKMRERRIPAEVSAVNDDFYSEYNQIYLKKAISDLNAGKGKVHELVEVE